MPNQSNFRSDITTSVDSRFIASRIVRFPEEEILYELIPASFGYDIVDNIEVHFYTIPDNLLLSSIVIRAEDASDILKSHIVSYNDGTFKNYIRIDFTALFNKNNTIILPGDYKIVLNFFTEEIGNYDDRRMFIEEISDSRTEVQLQFFNTNNLDDINKNISNLNEFVEPSFSKPFSIGVAEKIFRSGVKLADDNEGLTYNNIINNIDNVEIGQTFEDTIGKVRKLSPIAEELVKESINNFLPRLYEKMREEIVIRGDRRIQEDEFRNFIESVVDSELKYLQSTIDRRILIT